MSEKHSPFFNRRACGLLIAGAFILLAIYLSLPSETLPPEPVTHSVSPAPPRDRVDLANPSVFDAQSFYRTIIDNNLFRPLGWTPPRPKEPYRLIGTILSMDDRTPPKAILQTTAGHRTLIVSTGDNLDASTKVVLIEGKQVVLSTEGRPRTLRLSIGL